LSVLLQNLKKLVDISPNSGEIEIFQYL